jgi:hypothetical protein
MEVLIMSDTRYDDLTIVTFGSLALFKDELVNSLGIKLGNTNSLIQQNAGEVYKVANSAFIGEAHQTPLPVIDADNNTVRKGLKNVFVAGLGNSATAWNQSILGTFNAEDPNALFIIGNGTGEYTRHNVLQVNTDGTLKIHGVEFNSAEPHKLDITGKLAYKNRILADKDLSNISWTELQAFINSLDDDELVSADFLKSICANLSALADFDINQANSWRNTVVQNLENIKDNISGDFKTLYDNIILDDTFKDKAMSLKDGQFLFNLIKKIEPDSQIVELHNKIDLLKRQVSYLISCLTVDKIVNNETEYYAVGIADYALDLDTKFKIHSEIIKSEEDEIDFDSDITEDEEVFDDENTIIEGGEE